MNKDIAMDVDLYELIGTVRGVSIQEIKKAYRKKALSCHPDKNPDNPKAAELFHELSRALEILTDASARAAYDKVLEARQQAKLRTKELDAKRRKLKEDLEAREEAYKRSLNPQYSAKTDEDRLKAEIERLRKEGSKQVEEEVAFVKRKIQEQLQESLRKSEGQEGSYKIKIKWKTKKTPDQAYNYDTLYQIFSKYGDIAALIISPTRDGRALIEFHDGNHAETAARTEIGFTRNPLTLERLWKTEKSQNDGFIVDESRNSTVPSEQGIFFMPKEFKSTEVESGQSRLAPLHVNQMSDAEFERSVLHNLKMAQEKKRNLEKMNSEEGT